jgi:hypothetical protein
MGLIKYGLFLVGLYTITYTITKIILRMNKKQYNITHYYPQNAINV